MNFFSNVLDSLPVVGHVKGVVHYAVGDKEGGNKAMYQATRTTAVLGAGAAGSLAGPGGAIAAAMYAGVATDTVASVAMDNPQGIVKGCKNVAEDIKEGRNPAISIASTGFQVGMDGLGGLGMGGVSSAASQVSEKAVAKTVENVAKKAVATVGEKAIQKTVKVTGEEAVKMVTKTVTERAVKKALETAAIQAEVVLVSAHVGMQAKERTEEEERKRQKEERQRRDRERERRAREEREQREREERERRAREEREQREREQREREERERRAREERENQEQRARQQQAQRAREEQEQWARQQQAQRAREEQEQRAREEQEQRARQQAQRAREEQEQRARQQQAQRARQQREQQQQRNREPPAQQQPASSETSSGPPPPPRENRRNDRKKTNEAFARFKETLERILEQVFGNQDTPARRNINRIFTRLSDGQIDYLVTIIERLQTDGILEEVLKLVIQMFSQRFPNQITFGNFLSLLEFVAVYIDDELSSRVVLFRMAEKIDRENDPSIPKKKNQDLVAEILADIMNLADIVSLIVDVFVRLRFDIETEIAPPNPEVSPHYRDIFAAVYHYFKHRCVPGDGVLSVKEYYDWIRRLLKELEKQRKYAELLEAQRSGDVNANVVFDLYVVLFGRRFRIVVKFQGRNSVLASCFVVEKIHEGDKEGDVWIVVRRF